MCCIDITWQILSGIHLSLASLVASIRESYALVPGSSPISLFFFFFIFFLSSLFSLFFYCWKLFLAYHLFQLQNVQQRVHNYELPIESIESIVYKHVYYGSMECRPNLSSTPTYKQVQCRRSSMLYSACMSTHINNYC